MKTITILILTFFVSVISYGQIDSLKSLEHIRNHFIGAYKDIDFNPDCQKCYDCVEILKSDSISRRDTNEYFQSRTAGSCIALRKYKELIYLDKSLIQFLKNDHDSSSQLRWLQELDKKIESVQENSMYTRAEYLTEHLEFAIEEYLKRIEEIKNN